MDPRVWRCYVAVVCSQAWKLDAHDTEELLACIEALTAAPITGSAAVQVDFGNGVGRIDVDQSGGRVLIGVRD